jgi:hypothetical protein
MSGAIVSTEKRGTTMQKKGSAKRSVEALQRRYARLVERLGKTALILQGTITERTIVQADPKNPKKQKIYGPYYQWTFKLAGKTTTVNLTASQAKAYQRAIDNQRKMETMIQEMRELSLRILQDSTVGVRKRKPRN